VGHRVGLGVVAKRKIPSPRRVSHPDRPARSQVAKLRGDIYKKKLGGMESEMK